MNNASENKNIHEGHRKRVREKFLKTGLQNFEDYQLLEFLLFYVYKRKDTNEIGHELMNEFHTLENVFSAPYDELCKIKGVGDSAATLISLIGQMRNRINTKPDTVGKYLPTNEMTGEFCVDYLKNLPHERLILISMNSERKVLGVDIISDGDHSATAVDIRKILKLALKRKAVGVVLAHNHPGDSPHPSDTDIAMTAKVISVLEGIDILVIDHIVCNDTSYASMATRGILDEDSRVRGRF